MPFSIVYNTEGDTRVVHKLQAFAGRAIEPAPALAIVAEELRKAEAKRFAAEGPGWAPLADSTIAKKGSTVIGRESDAMMRSLTEKGAEGAIEIIQGSELVWGTSLTSEDGFPYPKAFNDGTTRGQPPRPLFDFGQPTLAAVSRAIQAYLVGADRAEFGLNMGGDHIYGSDLMPRF